MGSGIGMPAHFYLHLFGRLIWDAFGETPYHVGSSLTEKMWRDVDVRLMLGPEKWDRFIGEAKDQGWPHPNGSRRAAIEMAFSALGHRVTGLPIDFQIQQTAEANAKYDGRRSAIGLHLHHHCSATMDCPAFYPTPFEGDGPETPADRGDAAAPRGDGAHGHDAGGEPGEGRPL